MRDQCKDGRIFLVGVNEHLHIYRETARHSGSQERRNKVCVLHDGVCHLQSCSFIPLESIPRIFALGLHLSRRSGNFHEASPLPPPKCTFCCNPFKFFFWWGVRLHCRAKRLLAASCPSVRVSTCIGADPTAGISVKFVSVFFFFLIFS